MRDSFFYGEYQPDYYHQRETNYEQQYYNSNYYPYPHESINHPETYQNVYEQYAKPVQPNAYFNQSYEANNEQGQGQGQVEEQLVAPNGSNFIGYFKDANGQMDFDKIFSTVGQFTHTVKQVTPMFQQVGSLIKTFRK